MGRRVCIEYRYLERQYCIAAMSHCGTPVTYRSPCAYIRYMPWSFTETDTSSLSRKSRPSASHGDHLFSSDSQFSYRNGVFTPDSLNPSDKNITVSPYAATKSPIPYQNYLLTNGNILLVFGDREFNATNASSDYGEPIEVVRKISAEEVLQRHQAAIAKQGPADSASKTSDTGPVAR